jgi:ferrochelatase
MFLGMSAEAWQYRVVTFAGSVSQPDVPPSSEPDPLTPYDAVLLLSFGGPEAPEEVMPFLRNVTSGRGIPTERLAAVAEHYLHFGGRSPINDQNRVLLGQLRERLGGRSKVPVYWGNRNWSPFVVDALRQAHEDGARRVLTLTTSAYPSYSGCRQYREDIAAALITLAAEGRTLDVDKVRHYANHLGFLEPVVDEVVSGVRRVPPGSKVAFVTHSIPTPMNETSGPDGGAYQASHQEACASVVERVEAVLGSPLEWDLVYCSRSGAPNQPWLEPDINDHLQTLAEAGAAGVVVVPIGFISDHMEVVFDLDTEAEETAGKLGLPFARVATSSNDPRFADGLVELLFERAAAERGANPARPAVGPHGPWHDVCPAGCCQNLRNPDKPAACGVDWAGSRG